MWVSTRENSLGFDSARALRPASANQYVIWVLLHVLYNQTGSPRELSSVYEVL